MDASELTPDDADVHARRSVRQSEFLHRPGFVPRLDAVQQTAEAKIIWEEHAWWSRTKRALAATN